MFAKEDISRHGVSNKDELYLEIKNLWIKDIISIISIVLEQKSINSTSIERLQKIYWVCTYIRKWFACHINNIGKR